MSQTLGAAPRIRVLWDFDRRLALRISNRYSLLRIEQIRRTLVATDD